MGRVDSIKSTWYYRDPSTWTLHQWLIGMLDAYPVRPDKEIPVHSKTEKLPYMVQWRAHLWILVHAFVPLVLHQMWLSGSRLVRRFVSLPTFLQLSSLSSSSPNLPGIVIFFVYFISFSLVVVRSVHTIRAVGERIGYLDGDAHARDGVPDVGVSRVVGSLWKTTGARIALATLVAYDRTNTPEPLTCFLTPSWWAWLTLQIGLYAVVLDFWFYWYHRAMHDVPWLWRFHRTHHLTKHPNPLLTAYADHEQELFDMLVVPLLTWGSLRLVGIPLGFYQWWVCHQYITFTEVLGHSGLRMYAMPPSTLGWLLRRCGMELALEDHDLHHRIGYRKSHNYGKQTRVWDRLFGTCHDRIESVDDNIDWNDGVALPLF